MYLESSLFVLYYSTTERVSGGKSILCRVSSKNRIFSFGCRPSLQLDTLNILFYNYTDLSTPEPGAKVTPIIYTCNIDNYER